MAVCARRLPQLFDVGGFPEFVAQQGAQLAHLQKREDGEFSAGVVA
jgi:hypothetical protein